MNFIKKYKVAILTVAVSFVPMEYALYKINDYIDYPIHTIFNHPF